MLHDIVKRGMENGLQYSLTIIPIPNLFTIQCCMDWTLYCIVNIFITFGCLSPSPPQ